MKLIKFDLWDAVFIALFCGLIWIIAGCTYHGRGNVDLGYQYHYRDSVTPDGGEIKNKTPETGKPFKDRRTVAEGVFNGAPCERIATFRYDPANNRIIHYRRGSDLAENNSDIFSANSSLLLRLCGWKIVYIRAVHFGPRTGLHNSNGDINNTS